MKTNVRIIAAVMVIAGIAIITGVLFAYDFDFTRFNTENVVTHTYPVSQTFRHIRLDTPEEELCLLPSKDGTCRVVCRDTEKLTHTAEVKDGTLVITATDLRKWYDHVGIFTSDEPAVTVYLPPEVSASLESLSVSADTVITSSADADMSLGDIIVYQ